jgi:hypothetical protein
MTTAAMATMATVGIIPGEVNIVGHNTTGQCVGLVGG